MPDQENLASQEQRLSGEILGVLRLRLPIGETLLRGGYADEAKMLEATAPMRKRLLAARVRRAQPARDEKLVVALNGLAIQAFARAGRALEVPQYVEVARRSAERVWRLAYDEKRGLRHEIYRGRAQTDAFLDDYALFGLGCLALHEATGEALWVERAGQLADDLLARFVRADGTLATTSAEAFLLMPPPEDGDHAYPSGSAAAADLLLRLARSTGSERYAAAATRIIGHLGHRVAGAPEFWPALILALYENDFGLLGVSAGLLNTAAVVRVSATAKTSAGRDEFVVTLRIDDGYHVNANPATYDYLIATSVAFEGLTPERVRYPVATLFKPAFAPSGLKVYEGEVRLIASFPAGTLGNGREIRALVSAQACNSEICLPPAKLPVTATSDKH